jgi:hypothetical protein
MMRTPKDLLTEYSKNGETSQAANYLRFLVTRSRKEKRKYPDPRTKDEGKSGDWQITRSQAARAFIEGDLDAYPLLILHIRDAFQARHEDETPAERKERALVVLGACLDAVKTHDEPEPRNFFNLVDAASSYCIKIIEEEKRFPTKEEVMDAAQKKTKIKVHTGTEKTRILKAAYLAFLPKQKPDRSGSSHQTGEAINGGRKQSQKVPPIDAYRRKTFTRRA